MSTSKGNPVTDILILEADSTQTVHATIYPSPLPGNGPAVLSHDIPFTPVKTLVIGLTEGQDADGNDKIQIVMFLDSAFATAHAGIPFSSIFSGARHSETIASLEAAVSGDSAQLAWFTDTFFSGPAAGAAFDSAGPFTVAEFTSLTIIGGPVGTGSWMINSMQIFPFNDPNGQSGRATAVINETAKMDLGPFDIALRVADDGQLAIDKTVTNNTGVPWTRFEIQLGTGSGAGFVASTSGDGLFFVSQLNNRETTGAFPMLVVQEDRIVFEGFLAPGGTARFIVFIQTDLNADHTITARQFVGPTNRAPLLGGGSLAVLAALLAMVAVFKLRPPHASRSV